MSIVLSTALLGNATLENAMTLDELQREYATLRQQADAVRGYL
jgi:hypothetical protein